MKRGHLNRKVQSNFFRFINAAVKPENHGFFWLSLYQKGDKNYFVIATTLFNGGKKLIILNDMDSYGKCVIFDEYGNLYNCSNTYKLFLAYQVIEAWYNIIVTKRVNNNIIDEHLFEIFRLQVEKIQEFINSAEVKKNTKIISDEFKREENDEKGKKGDPTEIVPHKEQIIKYLYNMLRNYRER